MLKETDTHATMTQIMQLLEAEKFEIGMNCLIQFLRNRRQELTADKEQIRSLHEAS